MKSKHLTTVTSKYNYFSTVTAVAAIASVTMVVFFTLKHKPNNLSDNSANVLPKSRQTTVLIKSVRVDLSAMPIPKNQTAFGQKIINQLSQAGANTVYINPWSDGYANYQSKLAPLNQLGQQGWLEKFINQAHEKNLRVFAWFVVGKDDFPTRQHPEWYAQTIRNKPYLQEDEPGINIPFASLANHEYINYHLAVIDEVNRLPIDGWVISEPLIGWGDKYDSNYTDFSPAALELYQQNGINNPRQVVSRARYPNRLSNQSLYQKLTAVRAGIVTNFVDQTIRQIRQHYPKPIVITVFTEPDEHGNLKSFSQIKEWLGTDINKLASFNPDTIEIQSLFLDFEHPQPPTWTASMIRQFRQQLSKNIPLAISVQGFNSAQPLTPADFAAALSAAMSQPITGASFYAYHTLKPEHWQQLASLWRAN